MDPRAQEVVARLAEIERGEVIEWTRRGSGWTERACAHAEVLALRPDEGYLEVRHRDRTDRLHLPEEEVLRLVADAGRDASEAWGEDVSDVEGAARLLSVWLDESLATRPAHPTGWWTLVGAGFEPLPPWEAHALRHQG